MNLSSRIVTNVFLALFICLAGLTPGQAKVLVNPDSPLFKQEKPKFILIVIDHVTWEDYLDVDAPTLQFITQEGALGLVVARTAGSRSRGGYLTIGAGTRLRADAALDNIYEPEGFAFGPMERTRLGRADRAYTWLTGKAPGSAEVIHLGLPSLLQDNRGLNYPALPGQLGEVLRSNDIRVACLGNADSPGKPYRPIAALAMDAQGQVALGEVGPDLLEQDAGGLYRTSVMFLQDAFDRVLPQADFIAIDFGDTSRLAHSGSLMAEEAARLRRREALRRADFFLSHVLEKMQDKTWRLLIVSPHLLREPGRTDSRFSPIIMFGSSVAPGLLTSASTRTPAVVVNTDIAPTILGFFHLPPGSQMLGRPITSTSAPAEPVLLWLKAEESRYEAVEAQRAILIRPAIIVMVVIFAACGIAVLLGKRVSLRLKRWLGYLCLGILTWPIMMVFLGSWMPSDPAASWAVVLLGCLVLTFVTVKSSLGKVLPFFLPAGLTFILLSFSLFEPGNPVLRFSPL
ncbi:MAG: hypothetical protein GTN69_02300, partial [Armatimonadetes bacterium]|nr:hypothetical protein [Armatimonadota bacterium]NIO74732.1 hypothetical protein [Armatimonadota bacterium]NIO97607.1 hypothetical protein [Armatimonadota bacterium]